MTSLNRAHRTIRLLSRGWHTSMDVIRHVGSTTPTKCISEARRVPGWTITRRRRYYLYEYHAERA